jgi:hypothetical protein
MGSSCDSQRLFELPVVTCLTQVKRWICPTFAVTGLMCLCGFAVNVPHRGIRFIGVWSEEVPAPKLRIVRSSFCSHIGNAPQGEIAVANVVDFLRDEFVWENRLDVRSQWACALTFGQCPVVHFFRLSDRFIAKRLRVVVLRKNLTSIFGFYSQRGGRAVVVKIERKANCPLRWIAINGAPSLNVDSSSTPIQGRVWASMDFSDRSFVRRIAVSWQP